MAGVSPRTEHGAGGAAHASAGGAAHASAGVLAYASEKNATFTLRAVAERLAGWLDSEFPGRFTAADLARVDGPAAAQILGLGGPGARAPGARLVDISLSVCDFDECAGCGCRLGTRAVRARLPAAGPDGAGPRVWRRFCCEACRAPK